MQETVTKYSIFMSIRVQLIVSTSFSNSCTLNSTLHTFFYGGVLLEAEAEMEPKLRKKIWGLVRLGKSG